MQKSECLTPKTNQIKTNHTDKCMYLMEKFILGQNMQYYYTSILYTVHKTANHEHI